MTKYYASNVKSIETRAAKHSSNIELFSFQTSGTNPI